MKTRIISICLLLGFTSSSHAQSIIEGYVKTGLENNLALKQENFKLNQSMSALKEAKSLFMPDVKFKASYTFAEGGRTIDFPAGDLLNPVYGTLNQMTNSNQFPQIENVSEQLFPNEFHDSRVEFRQPLFNTDIYFNYKAKKSLISVQQARKNAYEKELIKEIKKGYYRYLQTVEVLAIYDSSEIVLIELLKINRSLAKNNKVTKDAVFNAEYELSDLHSQMAEAHRQNQLAKSYFNFLINRSLDDEIIVDEAVKSYNPEIDDLEVLQGRAVEARDEIMQVQKALEAYQYNHKLHKSSRLPELSIGGSVGYQGFGYDFNNEQDYRLLQLNLSVPIFAGGRRNAKIQRAKIDVERTLTREEEIKQQIRVQVVDSYHNLLAAIKTVAAKKAAAINAAESFNIVRRKYEEQQVILVEYLDARTKYTNSQINLTIAQYELLIKKAELNRVIAQ